MNTITTKSTIKYPEFNDYSGNNLSFDSDNKSTLNKSIICPKLKQDASMDTRMVAIEGSQVIEDGYFMSHKIYRIKTFKYKSEDMKIVERRYSDFEWLAQQLIEKFPGFIIPPIPEKNPLTTINSESQEFSDNRKRGLLFFLEKMFNHKKLRYAEDFKIFILGQDSEFRNYIEGQDLQNKKKNGSLFSRITSFADYIPMPNNNTVSFFKNIFSNFMAEPQKIEKTQKDHDIESFESHINLLETNINDLIKHILQLWTIEKDQAIMFLDMSSNFSDLSKSDKSNSLEIAEKLKIKTEKCSAIQKNFSKDISEGIEQRLKDLGRYVYSAKEAIKRRKDLKGLIEKNENKLYELRKNQISVSQYEQLSKENEKNKKALDELDDILLEELENFKTEIIADLEKLSERFVENQIKYSKDMYETWQQEQQSKIKEKTNKCI